MNRKRNVQYLKPEDPEFLKVLKKQAGYDDSNHKFDKLQNADDDFVDDEDSEKPQVVVLKEGDLTAEEADVEKRKMEKLEAEIKADLSQKIIFKAKDSSAHVNSNKRKQDSRSKESSKKSRQLLSFDNEDDDDENDD